MSRKKQSPEDKLRYWTEKLASDETAWNSATSRMDGREQLYAGKRDIAPVVEDDRKTSTPHVRNVVMELVETQVDPSVPQPKVSGTSQELEMLAKTVEDELRNELDRLPMEMLNDIQERTVRIQGGAAYLIEWDNSEYSHSRVGELFITALHPKQIVPQAGVFSGIEDMDRVFVKLAQTKEYIRKKYGVDVSDEGESDPGVRGVAESSEPAPDMVTQVIAYYRNDEGGIGVFSWVNDKALEDFEDYQARRVPRCSKCGQLWTPDFNPSGPTTDGSRPEEGGERPKKGVCPYCGSRSFSEETAEYEEVWDDRVFDGFSVSGAHEELAETQPGQFESEYVPNKIPYYKPDVFPVVLVKNISVFGQLLGESDVDRIADQQNTINRLSAKILDVLVKGGSYMTVPNDPAIDINTGDMKPIPVEDVADMQKFGVYTITSDISQLLNFREVVYEEARQQLGITDSYQGRRDSTATSGVAKEFSAQQAAGRMESKRVAKQSAWAQMFEVMFKFLLAYADEPRGVVGRGADGRKEYGEFDRYAFLRQDAAGEYYYCDDFLFACDDSSPLASSRTGMWQEVTAFFQSGAFGDPADIQTQILFWTKMELLHYPGAGETRTVLESRLAQEQQAARQQAIAEQQAGGQAGQAAPAAEQQAEQEAMLAAAIQRQAGGGI